MSQSDRAIKKLATQLARLDREVKSWRGAQADFTSIENGGNFTFKDGDGNVTAIVGGQDDGSNTIRHVDGPVPPIPSGLSAHVDGPIVQVSWNGTFEDADEATYDWSHLEVVAVGPSNEQLTATINDVTGASASVAATASGEWTVVARSVSRAEKRSLDGDAGTVEVKLVDIDGAIDAVQDSANGKNKVTYSDRPPTPDDPGIFDDTWFVGQVGRPNDIVEATNLAQNPSFANLGTQMYGGTMQGTSDAVLTSSAEWFTSGSGSLKIEPGTANTSTAEVILRGNPQSAGDAGKTLTISADFHLASAQTGSLWANARRIVVRTVVGGSSDNSFAQSDQAPNAAGTTRLSVTFTLPENIDSWYFLLANGSAVEPAWWDSLDIAESSSPRPYFDGDTESGATDNEPHYRWTGEPHASPSEKYLPALNIGDSDNWNVIEQYRHDGTGWVRVELSHRVFSTVDLGKATVGELDGIRIMGKTVRGEQLSGDAIDGKVITAPTIQSARSGQRWVGDPNGVRIINEDDDVRTQLSPDGSTFKGEVEADTLVVNQGAEFRGNNTLAQGAKLTLAAGVTDPTAPPVVQPYWDGLELSAAVDGAGGLAFDGTNYITARRDKGSSVTSYRQYVRGYKINASSGAVTSFTCDFSSSPGSPDGNVSEVFGVTCIGSELFWLGRYGYKGYVWVTDFAGVFQRRFAFEDMGYSTSNPLVYKPGIGNDGTDVVIAHCSDDGRLFIRFYNKTTGAKIGPSVVDDSDKTKSDVTGVYVGDADWGRKLVTVAKASTSELPSFSATTGVYDGAATKFGAATPGSVGVVFVDGKFRTLDPAGIIYEYADSNTGDASGDWWATYYWYTDVDDDGVIESSDYRSRMAPPKRFTWPRRASLKILGQPMPTGVEALGPALAKKTAEPVRTDFSGPGWLVDSGKSSARYVELPTDWQTYASPSETNTYPEAESSVIESASGTFKVQGDGSGHWGPLTMGRNGVMSGLIVSGSFNAYVDTGGTAKPFTVNLPPGRFTKPPRVWAMAGTDYPQLISVGVPPSGITTSNFRLSFYRENTTQTPVVWFAMDSE